MVNLTIQILCLQPLSLIIENSTLEIYQHGVYYETETHTIRFSLYINRKFMFSMLFQVEYLLTSFA